MAGTTFACPTCGATVASTERHCSSCGALVSGVSPALAQEASRTPPPAPPGEGLPWDAVAARLADALFGDFEILGKLGEGGMAAVFLAHEFALNRKVALKVMSPALMMGEGMVERFRQEAVTQANLQHAHIVGVHGVRNVEDLHFFVMQFVAGRTLQQVLRAEALEGRHLAIPVVQAILFQAGSALSYAHRRGVIHRDVKPGNILLNADGDAVVTDFGIAKVTEAPSQTMTGTVVGTPAYMSPEQCFAMDLTPASDQYSLGVVAYELLTGRPPFEGASFVVMSAHTTKEPPPLLDARPDCPPEIVAAVMRMLAKNRDDRFPDLGEALHALGAQAPGGRSDDPVRRELQRLTDVRGVEEKLADVLRNPLSPVPKSRSGSSANLGAGTPVPLHPPAGPTGSGPPSRARTPASATMVLAGGATHGTGGTGAAPLARDAGKSSPAPSPAAPSASPSAPRSAPSRTPLIAGAAVVALLAAAGVWAMNRAPAPASVAVSDTSTVTPPVGDATPNAAPSAAAPDSVAAPPPAPSANAPAEPVADARPAVPPSPAPADPRPAARLRVEGASVLATGERRSLVAQLVAADGTVRRAGRLSWSSGDPAIARVDARTGELSGISPGRTTITARSGADETSLQVTVTAPVVAALPRAVPPPTPPAAPPAAQPAPAVTRAAETAPAPVAAATEKSEAELTADAERLLASYAAAVASRDTARIHRTFVDANQQLLAQWQTLYEASEQVKVVFSEVQPADPVSGATGGTTRFRLTQTVTFTMKDVRGSQSRKDKITATLRRDAGGWVITAIR